MNTRFTKIKTIISLIAGILLGLFAFKQFQCYDCSLDVMLKTDVFPSIIIFIISGALIYLIWSLFEKK